MKSWYFLLSILVISIIIAILFAVYYGGFTVIKTPEEYGKTPVENKTSVENCTLPRNKGSTGACDTNMPVDFSKLRPLNTSLPKKEVLGIYRRVLTNYSSCADKFFLNPFAYPVPPPLERNSPFYIPNDNHTYPKSANYSALPKELKDVVPCPFEFAYIDDVYCQGKSLCNKFFVTLSEPLILSDGTVIILQEFSANEVFAGLEFRLIKTPAGVWNVTNIRHLYIS